MYVYCVHVRNNNHVILNRKKKLDSDFIWSGKWQYELMLGSKGVMQVGWATQGCLFSQEKGVGEFTSVSLKLWNGCGINLLLLVRRCIVLRSCQSSSVIQSHTSVYMYTVIILYTCQYNIIIIHQSLPLQVNGTLQLVQPFGLNTMWRTLNYSLLSPGDTQDSYAYDGNRQRKWNEATYKYGAMWQCGDIISCTIDLDEGVVEYFR